MTKKTRWVILLLVVVVLVGAEFSLAGAGKPADSVPQTPRVVAQPPPRVDPDIQVAQAAAPDGKARFLVYLETQADLSAARTLSGKARRGAWVYEQLRQTAQAGQADLTAYLDKQRTSGHVSDYRALWIVNALVVTADAETVQALSERGDVARLALDRRLQWLEDGQTDMPLLVPTRTPTPAVTPVVPTAGVEWNVALIRADEVWNTLGIDGDGVVVANMDTGVQYTHPALVGQYRGTRASGYDHAYNWFDATGQYPNAPADGHGHGTHTMGTIVGRAGDANQIGVAPGAQWIAVKALDDWGYGYDSEIHTAFQWLLAPTDLNGQNPDPSRAPQVVNNSWGNSWGLDTEFQRDVQAWVAAGIVPVFSAGNDGPYAGSIGAPASYPEAWAVGAIDTWDSIAYFSSRGPSPLTGAIKPEFCAPGAGVRSSWRDGSYIYLNGTSMAAPHVTGLVALLLQADPLLTMAQLKAAITDHSVDLGDPGPDYVYGGGRIDAYESVLVVSTAGTLTGKIQDSAGAPLAAATVDARQSDGDALSTLSDAQGMYTFTLPAETYAMRVSLYGYFPVTATVVIVKDETTRQDFTLPTAPRAQLSGRVTDAETGAPLPARITILDTPLAPVVADANGAYTLTVAHGTYTMKVFLRGYATLFRPITLTGNLNKNFALASLPPILLVDDDDDGASDNSVFTTTLRALGEAYDVWDVARRGTEPTRVELEPYPIVIWSTGASPKNLSPAAPHTLMAYLDGQGQLFLDNYTCSETATAFMDRYLHVRRRGCGQSIAGHIVNGVAGNPVSAWLGPYTLTYLNSYNGVVLLDPATTDSIAFTGNYYDYPYPVGVTYLSRPNGYRTVYLGFPFASLESQDGVVVLNRILKWFSSSNRFGGVTGQVRSAHTQTPIANVTLTATGARDRQTVRANANGVYTMTLLANTYAISLQRQGYFSREISNIAVTAGITAMLDVELQPQVLLNPAALTLALTAGQSATRTLSISNAGSAPLVYRLSQTGAHYTPTVGVNGGGPVIPPDIIPEITIPASSFTPTLDGVFTAAEWADATWVEVTPIYNRQGAPGGKVYLKHAAGNLYLLTDHYRESIGPLCFAHGYYFSLDGDRKDGHFETEYCYNTLETDFTYPVRLVSGQSATPDNPVPHWIFEYEIPMEGMAIGPEGTLRMYIYFSGTDWEETEWPNVSDSFDGYYPSDWGRALIEADLMPWLITAPLTGSVAAGLTRPVTLTFGTPLAQPGVYDMRLFLLGLGDSPVVAEPFVPISLSITPSETMFPLTGIVSDARTGAPLAATLMLTGGTPVRTDARTGGYVFWLETGTWLLNVHSAGYLPAVIPLTVSPESALLPYPITLTRDAPHLSLPPGLSATVPWGQTITRQLAVSNIGPRPLTLQLYETANGVFPRFTNTAHSDVFRITTAWPAQSEHQGIVSHTVIAGAHAIATPLSSFLCDPGGDVEDADFVCGAAFVSEVGWEGESPELSLRLTFAAETNPQAVVGYIHLDTDQNAMTGYPSQALAGSAGQDIGYDYYLDLFSLPAVGYVDIWRYDGHYIGSVPGAYNGQSLDIIIPLSLLSYDDGVMDVTLALGDAQGVTEQVPSQGHGTIGLGIDWIAASPEAAQLATAEQTSLSVTFDATRLQPGVHTGYLLVSSNDPVSPLLYLPMTLTVEPLATMGKVTGRVISRLDHRGLRARVAVEEGAFDMTLPTGAYELWLPAGDWNVRASAWPIRLPISQTFPLHITAGGTRTQDFTLRVAYFYLPLLTRPK